MGVEKFCGNPVDERLTCFEIVSGGVQPSADLAPINLAQRVQNEAKYRIPILGESQQVAASIAPSAGGVASPVDINSATARDLDTLPGVGSVMAARILAHRELNGPFTSFGDVENVVDILGSITIRFPRFHDL